MAKKDLQLQILIWERSQAPSIGFIRWSLFSILRSRSYSHESFIDFLTSEWKFWYWRQKRGYFEFTRRCSKHVGLFMWLGCTQKTAWFPKAKGLHDILSHKLQKGILGSICGGHGCSLWVNKYRFTYIYIQYVISSHTNNTELSSKHASTQRKLFDSSKLLKDIATHRKERFCAIGIELTITLGKDVDMWHTVQVVCHHLIIYLVQVPSGPKR